MTRLTPKPNAGPTQPVKHAPARPYIVFGSAVLAAVLLIIVVLNIGGPPSAPPKQADETPTDIEVFNPGKLTEEDLASTDTQFQRDPRLSLPGGGGIQVMGDEGISQRYDFARLDPNPPGQPAGWVQMEKPVADIYVAKDRVLRLEGATALAYVPRQALESGTMTGDVRIQLFEIQPGHMINPDVDQPVLIMRTPEATFNNILGEVRCPKHVYLETPDAEFAGDDVLLLVNDRDQLVQSMTVQHGDYIRIAGNRVNEATSPADQKPTNSAAPPPPSLASKPQPQTPSDNSAAKPAQFYELTLHDNVRIAQGRGEEARKLNGDALSVTFSFDSKGMAGAMAFQPTQRDLAPERQGPPSLIALSRAQQIAAAALASFQDERSLAPPPSDDDVIVHWDGPMTMEPVTDPAKRLASSSDAKLELFGSPLTLKADDGLTTVQCAVLEYHTEAQNPILRASAEFPGTMERTNPEAQDVAGDAKDGPPVAELSISWGEALELDFYDTPDGKSSGRLKRATFTKNVQVRTPDLDLDAENMKIGFFAGQDQRDAIETILATGGVKALRPGATPEAQSQLLAKRLLVEFALSDKNESLPRHVRANGNVEASDATQMMWADVVDVMLRERTAEEQARLDATLATGDEAPTAPGMAGMQWGDERMGKTELEALTAESDVQLLLEGGTRVWADKLAVDGHERTVTLTGDEVVVAHENFLIDKGKSIKLDDLRRKALMEGPGQFRQFDRSVQPTEKGKLPKPVIEWPSQARVRWTERMQYDEQFDQGNSAIEFHGQVDGSSQPSALESSTVNADRLRLEFERKVKEAEQAEADANENAMLAGDRRIRRLFAEGNAKIESRSWEQSDHADVPRVFYITGEAIDYDEAMLDAAVTGKGSMLMRDERPENNNKPAGTPADPALPIEQESFGARGTTLFRFTEGMRMTQQMEGRYVAEFNGNVEWLHKSLDGRTAQMTGQHLEAIISRKGEAEKNVDLDFGGPAKLERLSGKGGIFIRTATRDVQCEEFTYDPTTGVAQLSALPGRTVSVLTQGTAQPFQAERITWYMNEDRISIGHPTLNR